MKKSVLELGGSDPFIVMPSADLARAAEVAATARCLNSGQSCIAAKRFIVHAEVADEFERRFVARMAARGSATPCDDATDVGPLATEQQRDDVAALVDARWPPGPCPCPAGAFSTARAATTRRPS